MLVCVDVGETGKLVCTACSLGAAVKVLGSHVEK